MKRNLIVIDDTASEKGGAGMTLFSLLEGMDIFKVFKTGDLNQSSIGEFGANSIFLIGNCHNLTNENIIVLDYIFSSRDFLKIEFDYGFCPYRCEDGYKKFSGKDVWEPFSENNNGKLFDYLYRKICSRAIMHMFMSHEQLGIFKRFMTINSACIIGSSFMNDDLSYIKKLRENSGNNEKFVIIDGEGGWHTEAKGVENAITYCKNNSHAFNLISEPNYKNLLKKVSEYDTLVFLPNIDDTCPRIVIEASLLGLKLVINDKVQHQKEYWFLDRDPEKIENHIREKKLEFQIRLKEILNEN